MASQANMSEGPASRVAGEVPLVGDAGQEFVQSTLSTHDPATAIAEIQDRGALRDPRCRPLMGLLDQLGASHAESHQTVVKRATEALLARIPSLSPEKLLRLLEASFPFIGISDLRAIPIAVLDRLRPVPATFIKQLAVDRDVFWELPPGVQRQAWELDRKLLQVHALSLVAAYTYETATWMQGLNMDESLPESLIEAGVAAAAAAGGGGGTEHAMNTATTSAMHHKIPQLARRTMRNGSAALRRLTAMVGCSRVVYKGIIELCYARYRDSEAPYIGMKEAALCSLRSQLLMSLHDAGETGICVAEPCYKLAFTLDAGFKDKKFDKKKLKELATICSGFAEAEKNKDKHASRPSSAGGKRQGSGRVRDDDAESAGVPGATAIEDPLKEIGDAGMVLRDPAPFHLMVHQILRCLERCVSDAKVPKDDREIVLLTRLLTLAIDARVMLREQDFYLPDPNPEVLNTLYPLVADMMLEAELRDGAEEEEGAGFDFEDIAAPPTELVNLIIRDEISRKVVQMYALERLAAGDLVTGRIVLRTVASCLDRLSTRAVPEFAPFAFTLARRLATLYNDGRLNPSQPLWSVAVDGVLIRLVDAETEVHEEVLRLLLAAAPNLEPAYLATSLAATLANSRGSRKLHKKRAVEEAALPAGYYDEDGTAGGYSTAEGWGSPTIPGSRGADGVRGTYHLFLSKQPGLNRNIAPALFTYLDASG